MNKLKEISVRIGEIKIANAEENIKAILGSCVGIALIWKKNNTKALAHCLLPHAPHDQVVHEHLSGKYVSTAIPKMLELLNISKQRLNEIEAHIAGGANMLGQVSRINRDQIGQQNIEAALHYLNTHGIAIKSSHIGGLQGRQIYIGHDGHIKITTFNDLLEQK